MTGTSFAARKFQVEAAGAFNLLSSTESTSTTYTYEYTYNGKTYAGVVQLQPGQNTITITTPLPGGGTVTHQINVTEVPTLLAKQGYVYDELNRIKTYTNGNGITTSYYYDLAGRLVQTSASNGNVTSFAYDASSRRTSMTDSTGTTFYGYDSLNRVTSVTYSTDAILGNADDLSLTYAYDNGSRMTDITYPGGEHIQYTYDSAGRMLTANDLATKQNVTYVYNSTNGLLQTATRSNGIVTTYSYDGAGRLTEINHAKGGTTIADYTYTLDPPSGNALNVVTTFPDGSKKQEVYTYDNLNRLTKVIYGSANPANAGTDRTVSYTYDPVGNRLTQTTQPNGTSTTTANTQILTYSYGSENRLLQITDQTGAVVDSYTYDAAGNRIQKVTPAGNTVYIYNEKNLLTSVITPSSATTSGHYITYTYNGDNQRVSQTVDGVTTNYIIDPVPSIFQTVQERSGGAITQSYVYGLDRGEENPVGGTPQYYLSDRLDSVRVITDSSANVLQQMNFDVFGKQQ